MLDKLIEILNQGNYSCVIGKGDEIRSFTRRGVIDLFELLNGTDSDFLNGASVADKVIGKAAASLLILGGVKEIYAGTISTIALDFLHKNGVNAIFSNEVPHIVNRAHDGWCPLETATFHASTPTESLSAITEFINNMKSKQH
jgi:hypothetical protein